MDDEATATRLADAIRELLARRDTGKTICPSEAARAVGGADWRTLMPATRRVAWELEEAGWLQVTQNGRAVERPVSGPIRLRRATTGPDTRPGGTDPETDARARGAPGGRAAD